MINMQTTHTPDNSPNSRINQLIQHQNNLRQCRQCPDMTPPVITGTAVLSPVMLIGQAPGIHEAEVQKPFGWTAGKTLFSWFETVGVTEQTFRDQVFIASVCRCFPGKQVNKQGKVGGDRVPSKTEISRCAPWLHREVELLKPQLIIAVGKLSISQYIDVKKLTEVIGTTQQIEIAGHPTEMIPLPHPSGASTWHRMEPGKTLLQDALQLLNKHPAWQQIQEAG